MFTSEAIEVSMMSRLHSSTISPKGGRSADEPRVDLLHGAGLAAVDEDAVDQVQELVAGRPRRGPAVRQMLAGRQDLLGHHVEVARRLRPSARAHPSCRRRKYSAGA